MFLATIWIQGAIVLGVVILFLVSVVLNHKTKAPEGIELPEKCQTCPSTTCVINVKKIEEMKKEILESKNIDCPEEEK